MTMTDEAYQAAPGVSHHKLCDFRKSPLLYYRAHVMQAVPRRDSATFIFGRAVHCLALEGAQAFNDRFVEKPEDCDRRTKAGKLAYDTLSASGKTILDTNDWHLVHALAARVRRNPHVANLMRGGHPEVVKFTTHARTGISIKGRADWCTADGHGFDLKTCYDLDRFAEDIETYHYAEQAAFYADLFNWTAVYLVAVEKQEPMRVGVYRVMPCRLARAQQANEDALVALSSCYATDNWPGDPDSITELKDTRVGHGRDTRIVDSAFA